MLKNNFFSFMTVIDAHSWEYHDACVWIYEKYENDALSVPLYLKS